MKRLSLLLSLVLPFALNAATYTVTNTSDSGVGSLRAAITNANTNFGPDNIYFNIPLTDAGYNASTGTFTISLASLLPYISGGYTTIDASTQSTNQGNTNTFGPEIALYGGDSLDYSFALVSMNNVVKGFIIAGFNYGILLYNSTGTGNTISNNYIGINFNGTVPYPNQYGISIAGGANSNTITGNLISGNAMGGIAATQTGANTIKGNKIGTDVSGTIAVPNPYGIAIDNTTGTIIGGLSSADRNIISGNSSAGIVLNGNLTTSTQIKGNYIGINTTGSDSLPNANGIIIAGAKANTIGGSTTSERNVISGNTMAGIVLNGSGTRLNTIKGNYIGTSASGNSYISNHTGVMLKSNSNSNIIGGSSSAERNVISGNIEIGVYIESSDSNVVSANFIGPDATGTGMFKIGDSLVQGNGIEVNTVSKHNIIGGYSAGERNIISGNRVYGMIYYGNVSYNPTVGNYIGTDVTGNNPMPNATGICVDGGSNHNTIDNNVLSGNISYGIFIVTTGTNYNVMTRNLVGTNAAGTDTVPNDVGVLLGGGAKYNVIGGSNASGRNIISGNRYNGIEAADVGTSYNEILGNFIGTSISGSTALPNKIGIGFSGFPSLNRIDQNVISGNSYLGIILYDQSNQNTIVNNAIGVAADGSSPLKNGSTGIVIGMGSSNNIIGLQGQPNLIANNDSAGIVVMSNNSINNSIIGNSIYNNGYLGIDIFPPGVNTNDAGDIDNGPNQMMNFPVITAAEYQPWYGYTQIIGTLDCQNPLTTNIRIYLSDNDILGYGEGREYLGMAQPDASGNWSVNITGDFHSQIITATATDALGNTSEFCANFSIAMGVNEIKNSSALFQAYPNPASDKLNVSFSLTQASDVVLKFYSICGQLSFSKDYGFLPVGNYSVQLNLKSEEMLRPGVYLLQVYSENKLLNAKKVVLK